MPLLRKVILMRIVRAFLGLTAMIVILVFVVIASIKMNNRICSEIQVVINYAGENHTVTKNDICQLLDANNIETIGLEIKKIDLPEITKLISKEPFIKSIDKINFSGTKLRIEITLRQLLLHLYPVYGDQYFIDTDGYFLPYSAKVNEKLIIANGNITTQFKTGFHIDSASYTLRACYQIACELLEDPFYQVQFRQIYVNKLGQIELVSSIGNQIALLGNDQNLQDKLLKLKEIYINVLPYSDQKYSRFDVRFKNRVIAEKS